MTSYQIKRLPEEVFHGDYAWLGVINEVRTTLHKKTDTTKEILFVFEDEPLLKSSA